LTVLTETPSWATSSVLINLGAGPVANGIGVNVLDSSGTFISFIGLGVGNVISGNTNDGVLIKSSNPTSIGGQNFVQGNLIGPTRADSAPCLTVAPVSSWTALATTKIGCTIPGEGNIIAGNGGDGVEITGGASTNLIQGNFIGVGVDQTTAIGNLGSGVEIYTAISVVSGSSMNTIGVEVSKRRDESPGPGQSRAEGCAPGERDGR